MTSKREDEATRWALLKELVGDALLEEGAEREASLKRICAEHPDLREDIEGLLKVDAEASGFLDGPTAGLLGEPMPMPTLGARIGSYQLQSILGVGGSSIVYAAEQAEPRRMVALKVLLEGAPSPGALQRFALEAELLASLHHPAIAQVFEAGTSDNGRPWIAMELVQDAKPITDYAHAAGLDQQQRIELLSAVCAAISHGHRSGVIHRDIKPANLLVDSDGRPRVIDFGVAKLQGARASFSQTLPGSFLGTLTYMSPEQARGRTNEIDTRSDVYSLGVLTYELLCGELPYDLTGLSLGGALEYLRNPSPTRPRDHGITGDLEAVILHALDVDADRRYPSALDLAEDLQSARSGEPVRARPPSLLYFTRCFVRRHRLAVVSVLVATLALFGGALGFSLQTARVESRERARAEQVKDFLLSVLAAAVPRAEAEGDWPLSAMLEDASARIDLELSDNPKAAFEVHATIGKTWRDLGHYDRAEQHLTRAVALAESAWGPDTQQAGVSGNALADVLLDAGKFTRARIRLNKNLAIFGTGPDSALPRAIVARKLAEAYLGEDDLVSAEQSAREALDVYARMFGMEHEATARGSQTLGRVLLAAGEAELGLEQLERALASDEKRHGLESLATARMRLELATGLRVNGQVARAEKEEQEARRVLENLLPANHPLLEAR